ncbi:MAG: hypothetical protein E7160_01425 [Firmicutes bacterium]|nr:hypothetical protein [Bacillota bacterium]
MYYKVNAYQTEEFGKSEYLCDLIVYKKRFTIYELLTNEPVSIKKSVSTLGVPKIDGKLLSELASYGKSVFILKNDINEYNIATEDDVKEYIDESEENLYTKFIEYKKRIDKEREKYQK